MMYFLNLRLAPDILQPVRSQRDVFMRRDRVSSPYRKELNGESVAPVSRRRSHVLCNKRSRSNCFGEADAVVARACGVSVRDANFPDPSPVEFTAVDDHTAKSSSMAADEFGCGMNNDVRAVLIGRTRYGVAKVLSITSGILFSCAIFASG